MKTTLLSFAFSLGMGLLSAQTPIVFQPGPGANDGSDEGGLSGGKDAWVNEDASSTNYGNHDWVYATPTSNCNTTKALAFIKFDLSSLPAIVDSVFVAFAHYDHTSYCISHCNADFYFAYMMGAWDEMTINYNNFPSQGNDIYGPINISFPNSFGTHEYKITTAYNDWKSGAVTNHGFVIYSPNIDCNNAAVGFYAHSSDDVTDATLRPYLKIYTPSNSIAEKNISGLESRLFPNPSSEASVLQIQSSEGRVAIIEVLDMQGKVLGTMNNCIINEGTQNINLPVGELSAGSYLVRIITPEGIQNHKLMRF